MNNSGVSSHHPGLADGPIYLDYNATTPVDARVAEAALPYLTTHFGNPSSGHAYAEQPRRALAEARQQLADLIGAQSTEIVFTAGGSEADNLAIRGTALAHEGAAPVQIITQASEHPAVLEACRALQRLHGVQVRYLPVDWDGLVDPAALADALTPETVLVSIMAANNETGVLQPVTELAGIAHARGVLFHTDAAQAAGKIPIDATAWGVDLLTIAGHKMYAPKGIGALYVRAGVRLEPLVHGGGQERGLRAGTESVALAVALGAAAQLALTELGAGGADRIRSLRDLLHHRLDELLPGRVQLNGHRDRRLPNTVNLSITGVRGDDLLAATPGIAAATGSACHTGTPEPSPVLLAMRHDLGRALSALRLTLGRWTTRDDIEQAAHHIAAGILVAHPTATLRPRVALRSPYDAAGSPSPECAAARPRGYC
jgi:cysteine desulfurase